MIREILRVKGLNLKILDREILRDISFSLKCGEKLALIGANGSGKTSLLRALAGIEQGELTGEIYFRGKSISKKDASERAKLGIGLVHQNPPIIASLSMEKLASRLPSALPSNLAIEDFLKRGIGVGLSGGERKRLELAIVMAMQPKLWLIDEIDAGLDPRNLSKIGQLLSNTLKNRTAIIVSHNQKIFDYIRPDFGLILERGSKMKFGKFEDLRNGA